jgi:hypothetical protein
LYENEWPKNKNEDKGKDITKNKGAFVWLPANVESDNDAAVWVRVGAVRCSSTRRFSGFGPRGLTRTVFRYVHYFFFFKLVFGIPADVSPEY